MRHAIVCLLAAVLAACGTHKETLKPEAASNAPAETIRNVPISAKTTSTFALKTAAPKPNVKKKSCPRVAPFELDCDERALYSGVEPMEHAIDSICPVEGESKGKNPGVDGEYRAKNNLCATGDPVAVTINDFERLQADIDHCPDVHLGSAQTPPEDRSCLEHLDQSSKHLGEGAYVRLVAFVEDSHPNTGEGVNCGCKGQDANDFHITLVSNKGDRACSGIVAEMIPHFRPDEWTNANVAALVSKGTPVRVEGPLFADTGHSPKPCGSTSKKSDPVRTSIWEIHPIKRFQQCRFTTRAKCKADDDNAWVELPTSSDEE